MGGVYEASFQAFPDVTVPVIDYSLLCSTNPDHHAKAVRDLGQACEEWGFFMVVNHEIPEMVMKLLLEAFDDFLDLPEEEKRRQCEIKNVKFPAKFVSAAGTKHGNEKTLYWRNYLHFFGHPESSCPKQLSSPALEYGQKVRIVFRKLVEGISESLDLEKGYIEKSMGFDSSTQLFVVNCYPPCPEPESATGIPPHTDQGLLTFLFQNGIGGLDIQHGGEWFRVNPIPGSILINTGDQLEVVSNGKYRSMWHRAVVNSSKKRISVAVFNGPSLDTVVAPAPALIREDIPSEYAPLSYAEYTAPLKARLPSERKLLGNVQHLSVFTSAEVQRRLELFHRI